MFNNKRENKGYNCEKRNENLCIMDDYFYAIPQGDDSMDVLTYDMNSFKVYNLATNITKVYIMPLICGLKKTRKNKY